MSIKSWFDYYLKNPDNLSYHDLYMHAASNEEIKGYFKWSMLQMIEKTMKCSNIFEKQLVARQQKVQIDEYPNEYHPDDAEDAIKILQDRVDEVKHAIWCSSADERLHTLAGVVISCYSIAQMVNVDLDRGLFEILYRDDHDD